MRPRRCYVCAAPATIADQRLSPIATVRLDGTVSRRQVWQSRFLCNDHEHIDPWANNER